MTEWIEVAKKAGTGVVPLAPNAVVAKMLNGPKGRSGYLRLLLGSAVAAKLGWNAGTQVRIRWSAGAPKMLVDLAPVNHRSAYSLRTDKRKSKLVFNTSALPAWINADHRGDVVVQHEVLADRGVKAGMSQLIVTLPAHMFVRDVA